MRRNHSQDIVSAHDQPRYTISLFAKTIEMKQALWALYAFNYEVAKTPKLSVTPRSALFAWHGGAKR